MIDKKNILLKIFMAACWKKLNGKSLIRRLVDGNVQVPGGNKTEWNKEKTISKFSEDKKNMPTNIDVIMLPVII